MTVTLPPLAQLNPEALYDTIMVQIEPDLISTRVHTLKEHYTNESVEQKQARMERYKAAWQRYTQEREAYFSRCKQEITEQKTGALLAAEQESKAHEAAQLDLLENYFNS